MDDCYKLRQVVDFDCCSSCHDDEMNGFASLMDWEYKGIDYFVCCGGLWAIKDSK